MVRTKIIALFSILSLLGCTKDNEEVYTGGEGGSGTLLVSAKYNGAFVENIPVYLDWRDPALRGDPPPPGYSDTSYLVPLSGKPVATFTGLKAGRYLIIANYRDSAQNKTIWANTSIYLNDAESMTTTLDMRAN